MTKPRLTIVPSVPVWAEDGQYLLERKFLEGMLSYARAWPGTLGCVARRAAQPRPEFGVERRAPHDLAFALEVLEAGEELRAAQLKGAAVVLAAADDASQLHVAALCRGIGARCVYVIEYIPETRHQINALEAPNRFVRLRRELLLRRQERARRAAFRAAHAIQANGTPAHREYGGEVPSHLYFDTRAGRAAQISAAELEARLVRLRAGGPLRLGFSGRLTAMKGADHLPRVAARLRERGLGCRWTVYGAGELEPQMRAEVSALGLDEVFAMPGAVDFHDRLLPELKAAIDLYVMPHRQSDPSCTYLETLACGVPIVGYGNRALTGLLDLAPVGRAVAMDDVDGLAEAIACLDADREALASMARAAAAFARPHAFEDTFQRRVDHLLQVAQGVR